MKKELATFEDMHYLVRYPDGYEDGKKYPLLFLIHGAGMRGNDPSLLKDYVFYDCIKDVKNFPFVVVAPLCSADTWFDIYEKLKRFVLAICDKPFVQKNRVYAIGASMGGYCTWQLGMSMPELFAAIVPICGGGMYWNANRLKNLPVWAFHGEKDTTVKVDESIKMVGAVNAVGGNAKLTVYKDIRHDAWIPTYKNQEVYDWLLSISKDDYKGTTDAVK